MPIVEFRAAGPEDAGRIAELHADSWRRHYRGAYTDDFLDGDVTTDRRAVWTARLQESTPDSATVLAEDDGRLAGFVHVIVGQDERWGSLVDNLHVAHDRQGGGIGRRLLAAAAEAVTVRAADHRIYLWVLAQNTAAQGFYRAVGATEVERAFASAPGGEPGRLNGRPAKLRMAWPDAKVLL